MNPELSVEEVLGRGGVLSRRLEAFQERPQQVHMAREVQAAMRARRHLLVEAPTGVGKSLAYLVPALLDMLSARKKVVVATHTIALQEQLQKKDLPVLADCLPVPFRVVKAMGRHNYLGLRRLELAQRDAPFLFADDQEVRQLKRVAAWSVSTQEGKRQELDHLPARIWEEVRSEHDHCLGRRCPTYGNCFFQTARRRLEQADLIITNHALYFTDLALRRMDAAILPDHEVLILDEAHHAERVAAEHFGMDLSRGALLHYLGRLVGGRSRRGLLQSLPGRLAAEALGAAEGAQRAARLFFASLEVWLEAHPGSHGRIREKAFVPDLLSAPLRALSRLLEAHADACSDANESLDVSAEGARAALLASHVEALLTLPDPDLVYYIEGNPGGRDLALVARPLQVAPLLSRQLFDRVPCVVATSATLAVGHGREGLGYTARHLGVGDCKLLTLDSPFAYSQLVEVLVPAGLPLPGEEGYEEACARAVFHFVCRTHGGAFVLFTSFRALNACLARLKEPLAQAGLTVLAQGQGQDRTSLLECFKRDGDAVLFGADSFWEGVDVPGPALRLVVIARLPFPVPTRPLNEARAEQLRQQGKRPFSDFFLPEAVIRFRQGCGRLVRTEQDEGLLVCLDRRLVERPYGRIFRDALPAMSWSEIPLEEWSATLEREASQGGREGKDGQTRSQQGLEVAP